MAATRHTVPSRRAFRAGFSVIELMISVTLMGVIVYALYSVFNHTQRAMRQSTIQTDVSEKARAVMEMIRRELEQAQPSFIGINGVLETNLFGGPEYPPQVLTAGTGANARTDILPRTNFLHSLYFNIKRTNSWHSIGYRVIYVTNSVGVLQKYENFNMDTNKGPVGVIRGTPPIYNILSSNFVTARLDSTNFHHIADGVIHFSVIPYDSRGYRLGWDTTNFSPGTYLIRREQDDGAGIARFSDTVGTNPPPNVVLREYFGVAAASLEHGTQFAFLSNAMPAYMDVQLGIIEPEVLTQYYQMIEEENPNARAFLAGQVARVHIFRQRIPIRTAAQ